MGAGSGTDYQIRFDILNGAPIEIAKVFKIIEYVIEKPLLPDNHLQDINSNKMFQRADNTHGLFFMTGSAVEKKDYIKRLHKSVLYCWSPLKTVITDERDFLLIISGVSALSRIGAWLGRSPVSSTGQFDNNLVGFEKA